MEKSLAGKVALVAGATRGAGRGIAVQLGAAGATVYVTGRTTQSDRSEMNRPETIEETAALVDEAGGRGVAVQVDHLVPDEVRQDGVEQDRLGIRLGLWAAHAAPGRGHARHHQPLRDTAPHQDARRPGRRGTDGTDEYNATHYRVSFFYDLAKAANLRMAFALAHELQPHGATAVALTPGWLRSEAMLEAYGVTEANWRDATKRQPHFAISESPAFVGRAVAALARDPNVSRWNGQSLSSGQLAKIYGFTDLDGSQPDAWRYVPEVQDAGKPADVTGYR